MNNPGIKNLGDLTVTAADTQTTEWVEDLDGMTALTLQARFAYGSGGTAVLVFVQTSIDQGTTPVDIACFGFDTASAVALVNLSGLTADESIVTPTDGALGAGYVVDGILGDRLRL